MTAPTTRAMARRGTTLAVLAVLAGLLAGCGGGGEESVEVPGEPIGLEQLAGAASTSSEARSGRFSFRLEATAGAGERFSLSGDGVFDEAGDRAAYSLDLSSFAAVFGAFLGGLGAADAPGLRDPDAWKIDAVQDGETSYVRFPALGERLPEGKSWIRAEGGSASAGGLELQQLSGADPQAFLELLESVSGEVETLGAETLHGVETTHYRAMLDASSLETTQAGTGRDDLRGLTDELFSASELTEVPIDVWLDADGLVRKFQMDVSAAQPGDAGTSRATMTFELWDVGERVEIELPPGDQIVDATSLKR